MPSYGPNLAALKARLRLFVSLSEQCRQARTTEGKSLRELRGAFGLTQDDAGSLLGISKPYMSLIESGRCGLTPEIAERAADLAERLERCEPGRGKSLAETAMEA